MCLFAHALVLVLLQAVSCFFGSISDTGHVCAPRQCAAAELRLLLENHARRPSERVQLREQSGLSGAKIGLMMTATAQLFTLQ